MNNQMLRVWRALSAIYGSDLSAATLVVLIKDGDVVKYESFHYPQVEKK